jgi:hypothetical protein
MSKRHQVSNRKWKSELLKSSLPLELVVEGILRDCGLLVGGEFSYLRQNEATTETEFSVDTWARSPFSATSELTTYVLLECKFVTPGAMWVFSPLPTAGGETLGPNLLTVIEETSGFHVGPDAVNKLVSFGSRLAIASKGVAVHEKHVDRNAIRHGLYQMRFALPNIIAGDLRSRVGLFSSLHLKVAVICGIIVTTAPICTLKAELGLEAYQKADRLEDITDPVDALIVRQYLNPELLQYCGNLCTSLRGEGTAWEQLVNWRAKLTKEEPEPKEQSRKAIDQLLEYRFIESTQNIAVIQLDALPGFLEDLCKTVESIREDVTLLQI